MKFGHLWLYALLIQIQVVAYSRTYMVSDASEFGSILEQYKAGDSILFLSGHHFLDNVVIDKPVTLCGLNYPVIHAKSGGEILTIIADNVVVMGLEFRGVQTNYLKENAAIHLKRGRNGIIKNNRIIDCFFGIYLEHTKFTIVSGNYIRGEPKDESASGNAIHVWYSDSIQIINNTLKKHRDGIYFEFVNSSVIEDNLSQENTRYGLHFMFSNDDIYSNNAFINNGVGVAVMFSNRIEMRDNLFKNNWGRSAYGLLLKEIRDGNLVNNQFDYNTIGIYVEGSSRIVYEQNNFIQNGCAITISGGCDANRIIKNNFINNHLDFEIHGSIIGNEIRGNHWSGYTGYDLNKDLVGDVPHYPVKLFSHILGQVPESIVLMRSLLVDVINFAESVSPVFTPVEVHDPEPQLMPIP